MPQKSKLPIAEKVKIVENCLSGKGAYNGYAKEYGVHGETVRCWIRAYQAHGIDGLTPQTTTKRYSAELKNRAVDDYLSGKGSLHDLCVKYDISRNSVLQKWIRRYNNHKDFKEPNSGGAIYMVKGRNTTLEERIEIVSHCIVNNKDYGKTIEQYGVSYPQIYGWVRKYEQHGVDGLCDRRGKRKDEFAMTEVEKLQAQLKFQKSENLRLQMENDLLKKLEALERGIDID